MSSGDVGHLDENGLLFVDGRDDDMIVSGGENVFPREVEDLLADHEDVLEAAVLGVQATRSSDSASRPSSCCKPAPRPTRRRSRST
jgi:fatty-acyl-CoA synthase